MVPWNRRHGGRQSEGVSALLSHDYAWLRALYAAADVSSSRRTTARAVGRFHRTVSDRRVTNGRHRCYQPFSRSGNCPFNKQQHGDSEAGRNICSPRNSARNKNGQWTSIQWTRIQTLSHHIWVLHTDALLRCDLAPMAKWNIS